MISTTSLSLGRYESAESVLFRAQHSDKTQSITIIFTFIIVFLQVDFQYLVREPYDVEFEKCAAYTYL